VVSTSGTPWLSSPPTLAANWSYLNTPVDLNVTNTVATYRVNANVTGLPNNLAVFIWVNGTSHASNGALQLSDVQLESGAIATPFERKTFQEQLADCQRYHQRVPAMYSVNVTVSGLVNTYGQHQYFKVSMRRIPDITTFSAANYGGTSGRWAWYNSSTPSVVVVSLEILTTEGFNGVMGGFTGFVLAVGSWIADAEI
jgi:hypothetical protein